MTAYSNPSNLSKSNAKLLFSVVLANAVSYFDFLIFLFMADLLAHLFFPTTQIAWLNTLQVFGIFSIGYLARILGVIFIGQYADIKGRKPALLISLWGIAISTIILAFIPTFHQIGWLAPILFITARILQGTAFSGQFATSWVFLVEHLPARYFTFSCSCLFSAFLLGLLASSLFFMGFNNGVSLITLTNYGWRLPFILGGVLSFYLLYSFKDIEETPIFKKASSNLATFTEGKSLLSLFLIKALLHKYKSHLFVGMMISWFACSIIIVIALLLPNLIFIAFDIDDDYISIASILGILFMMFGCFFYGFLADNFRVSQVLIVGSIILIITMFIFYYFLKNDSDFILVFYALLGFASGVIGLIPSILLRLFPPHFRVVGVAFSYDITSAIVGTILPFSMIFLTANISITPALYVIFICIVTAIIGCYLYLIPPIKRIENYD